MNKKLIVIAPTAPPEVCGASDYAYNTAESLINFYDSVKIGVERMPALPLPKQKVALQVDYWWHVLESASGDRESSDVLLNYNPMTYAKLGWPVKLITALRKFKKANQRNKFFLFVHEVWSDSYRLSPPFLIRQQIAKYSFGLLNNLADDIAVLTEGQQQSLKLFLKLDYVRVNPIGSNILPVSEEVGLTSMRQKGVWMTFGLAGTRLRALQSFMPLLKKMYAQGRLQQLLAVGPIGDKYAQQETDLINSELGPGVLHQLGALQSEDVSSTLLLAEAALLGQDAASLHKSSSFAAMAAHAIPIIGNVPNSWTVPPGQAIFDPVEVENNPNLFSSDSAYARRQLLHDWFWSKHSWKAIGKGLSDWMQNPADYIDRRDSL